MHRFTVFLLCSVILLTACNRGPKRPADLPELVPCTISVTFGGQPFEGTAVFLTPKDKNVNKWSAGGKTDAEGKAKIMTTAFDGAVAGDYVVSFRKWGESKDMNQPPSLILKKYTQGYSKETVSITKDKQEYEFQLNGLK